MAGGRLIGLCRTNERGHVVELNGFLAYVIDVSFNSFVSTSVVPAGTVS